MISPKQTKCTDIWRVLILDLARICSFKPNKSPSEEQEAEESDVKPEGQTERNRARETDMERKSKVVHFLVLLEYVSAADTD